MNLSKVIFWSLQTTEAHGLFPLLLECGVRKRARNLVTFKVVINRKLTHPLTRAGMELVQHNSKLLFSTVPAESIWGPATETSHQGITSGIA